MSSGSTSLVFTDCEMRLACGRAVSVWSFLWRKKKKSILARKLVPQWLLVMWQTWVERAWKQSDFPILQDNLISQFWLFGTGAVMLLAAILMILLTFIFFRCGPNVLDLHLMPSGTMFTPGWHISYWVPGDEHNGHQDHNSPTRGQHKQKDNTLLHFPVQLFVHDDKLGYLIHGWVQIWQTSPLIVALKYE